MAKVQLVLICLLLLAPTSSAHEILATLDASVKVGKFALEASDYYDTRANNHRAKALVTIDNFSNQSLTQCGVLKGNGLTRSAVPITVFAGYKEGFAVEQNIPGKGVDMILSCRMGAASRIILVHFNIKQQVAGRRPNKLGVAVISNDSSSVVNFKNASSHVNSTRFTGHALQCAADDFVVQTTMSTYHQSELDIIIYPKFCKDFARVIKKNLTISQKDLDAIIGIEQSCGTSSSGTSSICRAGLSALEMGLIIVAVVVTVIIGI